MLGKWSLYDLDEDIVSSLDQQKVAQPVISDPLMFHLKLEDDLLNIVRV